MSRYLKAVQKVCATRGPLRGGDETKFYNRMTILEAKPGNIIDISIGILLKRNNDNNVVQNIQFFFKFCIKSVL